ncbi:hypothetical protein KPC83_03555 [Collinsella sp. zg1085]|uniref:RlpA-like double-psi beta-barrel domain-containing protein n=1 Tax=Collinsella sp. zg1085 TaxID=2844380 RepID=UPI001C0AFFE7|nr:RlpA-like double-psi beta-barrel domain-containing protein [Collinsella sp. zg1085]QWT18213.1 hypothetical protein KPC83_03555 [Collinsella sp. zg1085]
MFLGCLCPFGHIAPAFAAPVSVGQDVNALVDEIQSATKQVQTALDEVHQLQTDIDILATEILTLEEQTLPAQRKQALQSTRDEYKMRHSSINILVALLSLDSFASLTNLAKYLAVIQSKHVSELDILKQTKTELEEKLQQLSTAKDKAISKQNEASRSLKRAQTAHDELLRRAKSSNEPEAVAAGEAREQVAEHIRAAEQELAATNASTNVQNPETNSQNTSATTSPNTTTNEHATNNQPSHDSNSPSSSTETSISSSATESSSQDARGWKTGIASYYGIDDGFLGETTANGSIVTESSMGIAMLGVPFGTRVEITYRGVSVIAVVNDRGPYVDGRVIDMQPAVARALGFLSVGVDRVSYRFL